MHYTIEFLLKSDANILEFYKKALERWESIWGSLKSKDVAKLATKLSGEQSWFEHNCGGRWVGQEIMVVSGIASLYSTQVGFDKNEQQAHFLYDAFQRSTCSIEVKGIAHEIARSYNLASEGVSFSGY
jgi:hypothetical protein